MTSMTMPTFAAEGLLSRMKAHGIDYLFANGGTDFAPIIEGYATGMAKGLDMPKVVIVPHETAAIGMAHGYYLTTGRPQATMVHVNVGLGNCVTGIINAANENIPMLVMSGRTPLTEFSRPGARMIPVQYAQEMRDQSGMIRELVKWDYEMRYGDQVDVLVDRAMAIAMSEPRGPVYLSLPREPLAEALGGDWAPGRPLPALPAPAAPDAGAIHHAARLLSQAQQPLVICQRGDPEGKVGGALGEFALEFGLPVIEFAGMRNVLATDHPMNCGYELAGWLAQADVIVAVDSQVPWIQRSMKPQQAAKVIHIGPDTLFSRMPVRSFPMDVAITSNAAAGVKALHEEMRRQASSRSHSGASTPEHDARAKAVSDRARERRENANSVAQAGAKTSPMSPAYLSRCLSNAMDHDAVMFTELGARFEFLELKGPNRAYSAPHSGGLGWGLTSALGASLANRDRLVIATVGDGSYMFANPVACHQIAEAHRLPLLTVVYNNGLWSAVRSAALAMYPKGEASMLPTLPITSLEPAPDYAMIAAASRAWSANVENAADLPGAIEKAMKVIRGEKRQALLNVRVAIPPPPGPG